MKSSIISKDLLEMVNSAHRISRRIERQMRHAPSIQALSGLMGFLEK